MEVEVQKNLFHSYCFLSEIKLNTNKKNETGIHCYQWIPFSFSSAKVFESIYQSWNPKTKTFKRERSFLD